VPFFSFIQKTLPVSSFFSPPPYDLVEYQFSSDLRLSAPSFFFVFFLFSPLFTLERLDRTSSPPPALFFPSGQGYEHTIFFGPFSSQDKGGTSCALLLSSAAKKRQHLPPQPGNFFFLVSPKLRTRRTLFSFRSKKIPTFFFLFPSLVKKVEVASFFRLPSLTLIAVEVFPSLHYLTEIILSFFSLFLSR